MSGCESVSTEPGTVPKREDVVERRALPTMRISSGIFWLYKEKREKAECRLCP
jgi:hypothetical protein